MIQYKQKLLKIIKQKWQCHNIEDHTSEESYQDISMLQKAESEIIKMSILEIGCQEQVVFIN